MKFATMLTNLQFIHIYRKQSRTLFPAFAHFNLSINDFGDFQLVFDEHR